MYRRICVYSYTGLAHQLYIYAYTTGHPCMYELVYGIDGWMDGRMGGACIVLVYVDIHYLIYT